MLDHVNKLHIITTNYTDLCKFVETTWIPACHAMTSVSDMELPNVIEYFRM